MDTLKDIRLLVLGILKEGRINVDEADRIINYLNSTETLHKDKSPGFQYPSPEVITDFAREGVSKIERFVSGLGFNIEKVAQNINQRINIKLDDKNISQAGEKFTFTSDEQINLEQDINKIIVDNSWGSIKITGEERSDVSLRVEKIIWTTNKDAAIERDKGIKIGNVQSEGSLKILLPALHQDINDTINLELKVPQHFNLQLSTVIGNVNASNINNKEGKVYIKSNSGDIELKNIDIHEIEALSVSGDILLKDIKAIVYTRSTSGNVEVIGEIDEQSRLNTISGNIRGNVSINDSFEVTSSSGNIDIKTSKNSNCKIIDIVSNSGDIHYYGIVYHTLRLRTNSGKIKGESIVANTGIIDVNTTSGDIQWTIDDDCDISFKCESKSGDIFTNLKDDIVKSQGSLSGKIKDGKAKILLSSVSGDLEFHHDESGSKLKKV